MENNESVNESGMDRLGRLKQYLSYTPDNLNLLLDAISTAMEIQAWDDAEALINSALEHHPDEPPVHAHAGFLNLRANEPSKAQEHFEKAIEGGLEDPAIKYNLAFSQFLQHNFEDAAEHVASLKDSDTVSRESTLLYARCKHHGTDMDDAISGLKDYLAENKSDDEAEALLALMLYDNGDNEAAIKHANHCLEGDQLRLEALLARGGAYSDLRNYDNAYADFKKASDHYPESGRAWSGLGQIDFYNFQFDTALEDLEKAVEYMPNHIGTWHLLGWTHLMKNDIPAAKKAFETSYELDRSFGETHGGLASVFALEGDTETAEKHIRLAERLDPDGFSATYARMVILNKEGKGQEAQALFEQAKTTPNAKIGVAPQTLIEQRLAELSQTQDDENKLN